MSEKTILSIQDFLESQEDLNESVTVDTERYQGAHGKKPSGNGSWMFSKHKSHDFKKHPESDLYKGQGNYSEVKKAAVSHFKKQGHIGSIYPQT